MDQAKDTDVTQKPPKGPAARTCITCGSPIARGDGEVRLVLGPNGEIAIDLKGSSAGRGAHVHLARACLAGAVQRGLPRATKGRASTFVTSDGSVVPLSTEVLFEGLRAALDRRVEGLVSSAVRTRAVAIGSDAVTFACKRGEVALVMVATDAAAAASLTEVERAVAEGRAVAWGTKERLGSMVTRGTAGVAVVGITSDRIAAAIKSAVIAAESCGEVPSKHAPSNNPPRGKRSSRAERKSSNVERGA